MACKSRIKSCEMLKFIVCFVPSVTGGGRSES